jgi:molybdopterin-containing oxidoreductase family iron-sulfur binding subunit
VFGNVNDPNSKVSKLREDARAFRVLEILNAKPMISYLSKVRNVVRNTEKNGAADGDAHH